MLKGLERHFPPGCTWIGVEGGLVMWVGVPAGISVTALYDAAAREGVTFVAGAAFYPEPADQPLLRLNFAAVDETQIEAGLSQLGRLLRRGVNALPEQAEVAPYDLAANRHREGAATNRAPAIRSG